MPPQQRWQNNQESRHNATDTLLHRPRHLDVTDTLLHRPIGLHGPPHQPISIHQPQRHRRWARRQDAANASSHCRARVATVPGHHQAKPPTAASSDYSAAAASWSRRVWDRHATCARHCCLEDRPRQPPLLGLRSPCHDALAVAAWRSSARAAAEQSEPPRLAAAKAEGTMFKTA